MKNSLLLRFASVFLIGAAVLASCQRIQDAEDPTEISEQMTIIVRTDGTRTANDGNGTVWVEGDQIAVLHCNAENPSSYTLDRFTNVNPIEFNGRVHNVADVNNWYITYPYSAEFMSPEETPITVVNQTQNGNNSRAHMAGEAFPLYGRNTNVPKEDGLTINMQNILSVFRASVTNKSDKPIIVKKVVVTAPHAISGDFTGDLTKTPVVWTPSNTASSQITLDVTNAEALAVNAETYFFVGVMPFTVEAGAQLKIQVVAVHPDAPETEISFYNVRSWQDPVSWNSGRILGVALNFDDNHQTDPGDPSTPDDPQPELTPRDLAFEQTELVWTLGQGYATGSTYDLPALSGVTAGVTYTSSNTDVATIVNGNRVRLVAEGTTTITASAPATDTYQAGEASLSLQVLPAQTPSTTTAYTKVNSLTVGGTYVITDVDDARLFKGATDGSYVSVNPVNGVINDAQNTLAGYEFTVTQSGSKYCLVFNDGKYLVDDYQANSTTGLVYESTKPADNYLYSVTVNNGVFFFSTDQRNSTNTGEVLYYKPQSMGGTGANTFKIGGSGRDIGVHLYLKTSAGETQQTQTISFAQPSVTWTLGSTYAIGGSYDMPALSGAKTTVTYTSDNEGVAKYTNGKIEIMGVGTAHITATAAETAAWTGATARLTVTIQNPADPTASGYVRVTQDLDDWSGTYLFVDEAAGKAFAAFSGTTGYAVNVTIVDGVIASNSTVDRYALTVTDGGVQHANTSGQRAYDVRNADGKYIFYSSSTLQIADSHHRNNYDYYHAFKYQIGATPQESGVQVLSSGNSSGFNKYYLGYESSAFGYLQNGDSRRVQLYKLSDDVTPTPGPDDPTPTTGTTYTKVNALTVGGTYLITSVADDQLFNGSIANNNNHVAISPVGGVISDASNAYSAYEFTVEQSNGRYYLKFNDGKYLVCDYTNGDGTTGLRYVNAQSNVTYPYSLTVNNGAFEFSTTQMNSTSSTNQVLYYKTANMSGSGQNNFKIGGSGAGVGVHLYLKGSGGSTPTPDDPTPTTNPTYVKATSLNVGATYLVVDVSDSRLFTGATNGSYVSASPVNGVITDATGAYEGYEFTVTQSGSRYCLMFNGQYLIDDYSANSTTGLVYESAKPADNYLYSVTVNNGVFFFSTDQRNSTNTGEVLYYKTQAMGGTGADTFKLGGSGTSIGVHLYEKTGSSSDTRQPQSPSFAQSTVTLNLEQASGTRTVQTVQNAHGTVTYSSSNPNVAEVSGTTLTITGFGSTTITATAAGDSQYRPGSAYYTFVVNRVSPDGVFNLENDAIYEYITEATNTYTASNRGTSLIRSNGGWGNNPVYTSYLNHSFIPSSSTRYDCPKPVTVTWSSVVTGNKDVYVYTDAAHTVAVNYIKQPQTSSSSSVDIFNLIPGQTYYYVVRSGNTNLASGNFTTEGRRRMMKISSTYNQNNANNCRDLGGQITTSGKTIKYGKIFRGSNMDAYAGDSDNLSAEAKEEKRILSDYLNIKLDVDLRGDSERKDVLGLRDINKKNNAYDPDTYIGHTTESYSSSSDLRHSDKRMGATLARIMNAVHNNVNVYVHCMVGADRTGFTCMMIEALLGVPLERCDMDYEMTSFSVVGTRPRNSSSISHYNDGVNVVNGRLSSNSSATYQDKAIDYVVNVLGVSRDLITQFQNDMLE